MLPTPDDACGVFVTKAGSASNPGTRAQPLDCPRRAIELAAREGKVVFIATGDYEAELHTTVSLFGGYRGDFSALDPEQWPTRILAPGGRHSTTVVSIDGGTVILAGLTLLGGASKHAAAVRIRESARVTLVRNHLLGACGYSCLNRANTTGGSCSAGSCSLACKGGYGNCDGTVPNGCEVTLTTDPANCGSCGFSCSGRPQSTFGTCSGGACSLACTSGFGNCDAQTPNGCETYLQTNTTNCGACGVSCSGRPNTTGGGCVGGGCSLFCSTGYANCDTQIPNGCEVNTRTSATSCGACGFSCLGRPNSTSGSCSAGACSLACTSTYRNCDSSIVNGCETSVATATNCGACGNTCLSRPHSTAGSCVSGACALTCATNYGNCDGVASNGCETYLYSNSANCGACGRTCALGQYCSGTQCLFRLFF